jgi:hypothetical protein
VGGKKPNGNFLVEFPFSVFFITAYFLFSRCLVGKPRAAEPVWQFSNLGATHNTTPQVGYYSEYRYKQLTEEQR